MYIPAKTMIRIISFAAAGVLLLLSVIIKDNDTIHQYERRQQTSYLQSLRGMSGHLGAVSAGMEKACYAGTPAQAASLSAQVWRDAGSAKAAMGSLPLNGLSLDATSRFLSQAGDYAMHLFDKSVRGEALTEEERANFRELADYAAELDRQVAEIEQLASSGEIGMAEFLLVQSGALAAPAALSGTVGFQEVEDGFEGYPPLIYDGPFSDNILKKEPALLAGLAPVTANEARETAVRYTGVRGLLLEPGEEEASSMPSHTFHGEGVDIAVTKQGGIVTYFLNSRNVGEKTLSVPAARRKAREFLETMGADSMKETYYEVAGGICTVNFAFEQDGVTLYTDLIKVGIAMDRGDAVSYDARGFVNNHHVRVLDQPALPPTEARESLSGELSVKRTAMALIPTSGDGEVLTYEFLCEGIEGRQVLVYVNGNTGAEEQILILVENTNVISTL